MWCAEHLLASNLGQEWGKTPISHLKWRPVGGRIDAPRLSVELPHTIGGLKTMIKKQIFLTFLISIILAACAPSIESEIELDGTRWKLQNIKGQELLAATTITIELRGNKIVGSAGCNSFGAEYSTQTRGDFTIHEIARNMEDCIEPEGIMEQEEQFIRTLGDVTSYRAEGDGLVFLDEQGNILMQYERMPEFEVNPDDLVGRTWQLTSAAGWDVENLSAFTIRFEGSEFSGTTNCRDYAGNYQAAGDHLNVTFLQMTTEFDCDEGAGIAEGEYTTLLENVEQHNVSQTQLELYSRRGEKLVFELVPEE